MNRYGVEGRDIHSWIDEPSKMYTGSHREFRHDTETVRFVGELFGKTYGKALAENICLDHIMLDHQEEIQRDNEERTENVFQIEAEQRERKLELERMRLRNQKKLQKEELKLELIHSEKTPVQRMKDLEFYKRLNTTRGLFNKDIQILERLVAEDLKKNPNLQTEVKNQLALEEELRIQKAAKTAKKRGCFFLFATLSPAVIVAILVHPFFGVFWFLSGLTITLFIK